MLWSESRISESKEINIRTYYGCNKALRGVVMVEGDRKLRYFKTWKLVYSANHKLPRGTEIMITKS
jgi:hypothetical protein